MRKCAELCVGLDVTCPNEDCRQWINYEEDNNCTLIAVEKNKDMTLQEVGKRLGVSLVRIKHIEDKAKIRMKKRMRYNNIIDTF